MPRKVIDYSKGLIYKIVCKDLEVKDVYVGSTTDLCRRRAEHKKHCCHTPCKRCSLHVYDFIRAHFGWENWDVIFVEAFPCSTNDQLHARERHWIEQLGATLNTNIPTRTKEEWVRDNSEYVASWHHQYYEENKERLTENQKRYYDANKEQYAIYKHEHYEANKEKYQARRKEWYEANKEKCKAYNRQRYQKNKERANEATRQKSIAPPDPQSQSAATRSDVNELESRPSCLLSMNPGDQSPQC